MSNLREDEIDELLARWREGDEKAAHQLFQVHASKLIDFVRNHISANLAARLDPEDVVQSAYRSFFSETRAGRYELKRGNDLWQLLATIAMHKLQNQAKHNLRSKRSVKRENRFGSEKSLIGLNGASAKGPSPLEAVALAEQVQQLMLQLEPGYRQVLALRLEGYKLEEIAQKIGRSERTVTRILDEIKHHLSAHR